MNIESIAEITTADAIWLSQARYLIEKTYGPIPGGIEDNKTAVPAHKGSTSRIWKSEK